MTTNQTKDTNLFKVWQRGERIHRVCVFVIVIVRTSVYFHLKKITTTIIQKIHFQTISAFGTTNDKIDDDDENDVFG